MERSARFSRRLFRPRCIACFKCAASARETCTMTSKTNNLVHLCVWSGEADAARTSGAQPLSRVSVSKSFLSASCSVSGFMQRHSPGPRPARTCRCLLFRESSLESFRHASRFVDVPASFCIVARRPFSAMARAGSWQAIMAHCRSSAIAAPRAVALQPLYGMHGNACSPGGFILRFLLA